jgi:hypothetical protein
MARAELCDIDCSLPSGARLLIDLVRSSAVESRIVDSRTGCSLGRIDIWRRKHRFINCCYRFRGSRGPFSAQRDAQTIRSLQKIESEVDRSSSDTRDLIKAAWEKMLAGTTGTQPPAFSEGEAPDKEIAAGTAAELREEFKTLRETSDPSSQRAIGDRLNRILERLEQLLAAQIRTEMLPGQPGTLVDQALKIFDGLSPDAKALIIELSRYHITRKEYEQLLGGPIGNALSELRLAGVLVPLTGRESGHGVPVYWFPSRLAPMLRTATSLTTPPPDSVRSRVRAELERVGYRFGR